MSRSKHHRSAKIDAGTVPAWIARLLGLTAALLLGGCANHQPVKTATPIQPTQAGATTRTSTPKIDQLTLAIAHFGPSPEPDQAKTNAAPRSRHTLAKQYIERALAYAVINQKQPALEDVKRAIALDPSNCWSIGWVYFNLDEFDEALRTWMAGSEGEQESPTSWDFTLALGYWRTGDVANALKRYDAAATRPVHGGPSPFSTWDTMVKRTAAWTWKEKQAIYELYSAWDRGYRVASHATSPPMPGD